jgi:hypothetical protein
MKELKKRSIVNHNEEVSLLHHPSIGRMVTLLGLAADEKELPNRMAPLLATDLIG